MASRKLTYLLWLFFGWLGLHHLYLGRTNQAIIWATTFGGCLGVGWIRDIWRISEYITCTNSSVAIRHKCSNFHKAGIIVVSFWFALIFYRVVPKPSGEDSSWDTNCCYLRDVLPKLLYGIGALIGSFVTASIGDFKVKKKYPTLVCIAGLVISVWIDSYVFMRLFVPLSVSLSTVIIGLDTYDRGPERSIGKYLLTVPIIMLLLMVGLYHHATVPVGNNEHVPLHVVLANITSSQAWEQSKNFLKHIYNKYKHEGLQQLLTDLLTLFDNSETENSFKVLDLKGNASQEEILKRCKQLRVENHPDRQKSAEKKDEAQRRFFKIQEACEILMVKKKQSVEL